MTFPICHLKVGELGTTHGYIHMIYQRVLMQPIQIVLAAPLKGHKREPRELITQ